MVIINKVQLISELLCLYSNPVLLNKCLQAYNKNIYSHSPTSATPSPNPHKTNRERSGSDSGRVLDLRPLGATGLSLTQASLLVVLEQDTFTLA